VSALPAGFWDRKALIGMVHLPPLPGSARWGGDLDAVIARAVADAAALAEGGMDAVLVENFFDAPFARGRVPAATVAAMTAAALAVRRAACVPLGINVLRNDVEAALSIACACGAAFVRCNVYVGAAVTDQGILEGAARRAQETRRRLGVDAEVWADVEVKHAAQLARRPIGEQARDAVERGLADAVIVSGPSTGAATPLERIRAVKTAVRAPVLVGSGVHAASVRRLLAEADGAIVGTSLKAGGVDSPVDPERVRRLVEAARIRPG